MLSIKEYRELMKDEVSTEELIVKRLEFLEALCRNVARSELKKYLKEEPSENTSYFGPNSSSAKR